MLGRVATKAGRAATQYRRRPHAGVLNLSSFRQLVTSSSAPCAARQAASCAAAGETQASRRGVPVFLLPSPFCRQLSSATPKVAKPRAKVGPKAAAKPASVSDFLSQYWAYGIMGTLIAGGAFFTYNSIRECWGDAAAAQLVHAIAEAALMTLTLLQRTARTPWTL